MPSFRLTNRLVDGLQPGTKVYIAYDNTLAGFGCRVTPTGSKSWIVEFRKRRRRCSKERMTIGRVGLISAEQAREKAHNILARVRLGEDVVARFESDRETKSIRELVEVFLAREVKPLRKSTTYVLYKGYAENHVVPAIGTKLATELTYRDTSQLHRKIGQSAPTTANRVISFLSGLYSWAAKSGEVPQNFNPTKGVESFKERPREYFLNVSELERLEHSLTLAETDGLPWPIDESKPKAKHAPKIENRREIFSIYATNAIRLLLHTGCRLREILHLRWTEVDFERKILKLPDSKTGKKTVYLSDEALAIIQSLPRTSSFVIAGNNPSQPRKDLKRPWSAITRHAELGGVRIHDLRHTFASHALSQGVPIPVIGKLLGHRNIDTTMRYAHLSSAPLHRAARETGSALAAALSGTTTEPI